MYLLNLLQNAAVLTAVAGLLYSLTMTTAALTALFARTSARRRAARDVLQLLLCRRTAAQRRRSRTRSGPDGSREPT